MDRSVRSRTSSTSSLRSPALPSTPAPTPSLGQTPTRPFVHRAPSPDQLAASLTRLRAERALSHPAPPAPTPSPAISAAAHSLHPDAILAGLSNLGGDEGIASSSVPGTPAPTPISPSPSVSQHIHPEQIAASIARLREEGGVGSVGGTQPTTPSSTPAYPPFPGHSPAHHLGIIPEHLVDGIAGLGGGRDEGLDSCGSNPCTPIPTPVSPHPVHHSLPPEQLAAGITRLKVEEGMSSGGSTGIPATPAPTPFTHGPGGVRPEDLAAGISRLSVIQEAETVPQVAINVLEASDAPSAGDSFTTAPNSTQQPSQVASYFGSPQPTSDLSNYFGTPQAGASDLSNYFGTPQSSVENIFDHLSANKQADTEARSGESKFQDVTIDSSLRGTDITGEVAGKQESQSAQPATKEPLEHPTSDAPDAQADSAEVKLSNPEASNTGQGQDGGAGGSDAATSGNNFTFQTSTPVHQSSNMQELVVSGLVAPPPVVVSLPLSPVGSELQSPTSTVHSVYATPAAPTPMAETPVGEQLIPGLSTLQSDPQHVEMDANALQVEANVTRPESPASTSQASDEYSSSWIPSPLCREVLDQMANTPGTFYPAREQITCPGVAPGSQQGDPVRDLVSKYQGEGEASKRRVLNADSVTIDIRGLQQLISSGNYRGALNHTAMLLEMYGQGKGKAGHVSKHSQTSLQIWWARFALLVKLKLYSIAETEAEHFGDLEKPDLFYQYYPEQYGGRRGSMVPWALRLLLAQLPQHSGKHSIAINRIFKLLFVVRSMLENIRKGLAPDGSVWLDASEGDRKLALECWEERERQVIYALINVSVTAMDFESAIKSLDLLLAVEKEERKAGVYAALGRLYLQLGNIQKADENFVQASKLRDPQSTSGQLQGLLDSAFLAIGQGHYNDALERFQSALALTDEQSKLAKVIRNNVAVCLLYCGKLKQGLQILEFSMTTDPANMQGNPMLNLCTLYELESSYAKQKKIGLLGLVALHSTDSFPVSSLKL